jgi:hypothetical protein
MMTPTIYYDKDAAAVVATLPDGYRFASGPHQLVVPVVGRKPPKEWKTWARQEMDGRLLDDRVEPCDCEDCQEAKANP